MLISFDWLKQLIAIDKPADEVAALLTDSGLEVEGLETFEVIQGGLQGMVIGQVLTGEKHPDAGKVSIEIAFLLFPRSENTMLVKMLPAIRSTKMKNGI